MIVCLCHAVSERSIRSAVAAGASAQDIARATGAGTSCGCCSEVIEQIVQERPGCCSPLHPCPDCPGRGAPRGSKGAPTLDAA